MQSLRFMVIAVATALTPAVTAGQLSIDGEPVQGALLAGSVEPANAEIRLDGRPVPVADDGTFVIGFGRDAAGEARLVAAWPDDEQARRVLSVAEREYDIQRIDGLPQRKVTPSEEDLARIREEAAAIREARRRNDPRTDFASGWRWPVRGRITGVYGSQRILNGEPRRPHYGIDIAAPTGTPVKAPADGIISFVHPDMFFSGGTLLLDHGHGVSSTFLHLSQITVAKGDRVRRGDKIAEVGASGRVTGAHLDWRMNWFDHRVDPSLLVPPMPED